MYLQLCQGKSYNSCAYVFGDFDEVAINNFSKLEVFDAQNVPITVEDRVELNWGYQRSKSHQLYCYCSFLLGFYINKLVKYWRFQSFLMSEKK